MIRYNVELSRWEQVTGSKWRRLVLIKLVGNFNKQPQGASTPFLKSPKIDDASTYTHLIKKK